MRNSSPESSDWRHYEASEAALKRAADALRAARDILASLRKRLPDTDESPEYTELRRKLKRQMNRLAVTEQAPASVPELEPVSKSVRVSETIIKQIDGDGPAL